MKYRLLIIALLTLVVLAAQPVQAQPTVTFSVGFPNQGVQVNYGYPYPGGYDPYQVQQPCYPQPYNYNYNTGYYYQYQQPYYYNQGYNYNYNNGNCRPRNPRPCHKRNRGGGRVYIGFPIR